MRLATNAANAVDSAVRSPSPPNLTPVVACHQERSGRSPPRVFSTAILRPPSKAERTPGSSRSPLMRMWYTSLDTSAHCRVRMSSVGACPISHMASRSALVCLTHSAAACWMAVVGPNVTPRAVAVPSLSRTLVVLCTYGVSQPTNSCLRAAGQSSRQELLTLLSTMVPRVAPKVPSAWSRACSH